MIKSEFDLVIIGGGPAGLTAGIYACTDNINFILLEENKSCWFMEESINSHFFVEGFTGVKKNITGTDLKNDFIDHYNRLGGKIIKEKVLSLIKKNNVFEIKTDKRIIKSKAVIVASGTRSKELIVKDIKKFKKNIHYYCTIDGRRYIGKNVVVLGGRNSGVVAACFLHDIGCNVSLVEIKEKIQAKDKYKDRLFKKNIKVFTSAKVEELKGDKKLQIALISVNNGQNKYEMPVDGLFVYIGRLPNLDFLKLKIKQDKKGYILVNHHNQTSIPGIFAAGDVTCKLKQVITACGDAANAYYFSKKYIDKLEKHR